MNTITSDVELLQPFDISELDVYNALVNLDKLWESMASVLRFLNTVLNHYFNPYVIFVTLVYPPVLYLLKGRESSNYSYIQIR